MYSQVFPQNTVDGIIGLCKICTFRNQDQRTLPPPVHGPLDFQGAASKPQRVGLIRGLIGTRAEFGDSSSCACARRQRSGTGRPPRPARSARTCARRRSGGTGSIACTAQRPLLVHRRRRCPTPIRGVPRTAGSRASTAPTSHVVLQRAQRRAYARAPRKLDLRLRGARGRGEEEHSHRIRPSQRAQGLVYCQIVLVSNIIIARLFRC